MNLRRHRLQSLAPFALLLTPPAATTTRGLAWKIPGRVGDSPILGAGLYVDGAVGAAGSAGRGEALLPGVLKAEG